MSNLTDIADAVAAELNGATLSEDVTAVVTRIPEYETTEDGLKVFVVPLTESVAVSTRGAHAHNYGITVAIYKRFAADADVDGLDDFRQEVLDLLKTNNTLAGYANASLTAIANDPTYDAGALSKRVYASLVQLTYLELK